MKTASTLAALGLILAPAVLAAPSLRSLRITPTSGLLGVGAVVSIIATGESNDIYPGECYMNGVFAPGYKDDNQVKFTYVISQSDRMFEDGKMTINCAVQDSKGDRRTITRSDFSSFSVSIDSVLVKVNRASVSPSSGVMKDGDRVKLSFELNKDTLTSPSCLVNNVRDIDIAQSSSSPFTYEGTYTVQKTDPAWKPGKLPLKCVFVDPASNKLRVEVFNDFNTLAGVPSEAASSSSSDSASGSEGSSSNSTSTSASTSSSGDDSSSDGNNNNDSAADVVSASALGLLVTFMLALLML